MLYHQNNAGFEIFMVDLAGKVSLYMILIDLVLKLIFQDSCWLSFWIWASSQKYQKFCRGHGGIVFNAAYIIKSWLPKRGHGSADYDLYNEYESKFPWMQVDFILSQLGIMATWFCQATISRDVVVLTYSPGILLQYADIGNTLLLHKPLIYGCDRQLQLGKQLGIMIDRTSLPGITV